MQECNCKQLRESQEILGVGYKRRGFQIVKKGVSVYGMKSAKRMKCGGEEEELA